MKEFMMIFVGADYVDLGLSPEELQGRMGKWFAWNDKMTQAGVVTHGNALTPQIRRVVGANRTVTDLTSAEVKEIVGGYYIVKAQKNLDCRVFNVCLINLCCHNFSSTS